jgi:hypothetical protein
MIGKRLRKPSQEFLKAASVFVAAAAVCAILPVLLAALVVKIQPDARNYLGAAFALPGETSAPKTEPPAVYRACVVSAMRSMGLTTGHFDAWMAQHPDSVIKRIKYMPEAMQRDVAGIALFIRKTNPRIDAKTAWREAAALVHYSDKYGVPSVLSTAVAKVESTFNPDEVSSKGASGVMQVMWKIHNRLLRSHGIKASSGSNPLSDPEHAIAAGCLLLSRYVRAYGSIHAALNRYSGGGGSASYRRKVNMNMRSLMAHRRKLYN